MISQVLNEMSLLVSRGHVACWPDHPFKMIWTEKLQQQTGMSKPQLIQFRENYGMQPKELFLAVRNHKQFESLLQRIGGRTVTMNMEDHRVLLLLLSERNQADKTKVFELQEQMAGLNKRLVEAAAAVQNTFTSTRPRCRKRFRDEDGARKVKIAAGTLETDGGTSYERCHGDFKWEDLQDAGGSLFVGFAPLTTDGMFLQIWEP